MDKFTRRAFIARSATGAAAAAISAAPALAAASGDAALLALMADRDTLLSKYQSLHDADGPEGEALWRRISEIERTIERTPAYTPQGLAVRLRILSIRVALLDGDDPDAPLDGRSDEQQLLWACIREAERMQ